MKFLAVLVASNIPQFLMHRDIAILTAAWAAWPLKKCCVPLHELQRGNERVWNVRYESLRVCLEVLVPRWYCGMVEPSERSFQTVCVI